MSDPVVAGVQQLFVRHQSAVRAFAIALTGDFAAAEDVVQETFLTITAKAADFEAETNFVAWACAIARLKALENRRAARRFSPAVVESLADSIPAAELGPDLGQQWLPLLLDCLKRLPPRARELIRLRYFLEQGPREIATALGRTAGGVNTALLKARDALRDCMAAKLAADGTGGTT
ncbi:MAG: sigma-70 family RNA polymerase sigma factor [Planctomycetia bacterium]|nr:sigma-70 family RNA polymerase sigma factor [Planctomycetia bacterium]